MACSRFEQLPSGRKALSVFFTAGYPRLNDTVRVAEALQAAEVDMLEIGFPFSDPVADGPTIQESSLAALGNGMTVAELFRQLEGLRRGGVTVPVLLMGYLNPLERYGRERFFADAFRCGVDGLILPDMPFDEYRINFKPLFEKYRLRPVFLVTSRSDDARIRDFDAEAPAFLYVLSSDAVTGGRTDVTGERDGFFRRLREMRLKSRLVVGFGVSDRESFAAVTRHTDGAIIGSAFVRAIAGLPEGETGEASDLAALRKAVSAFIGGLR